MEKPIMNPELPLPEVFKWRVPINWDPVPWWFFEPASCTAKSSQKERHRAGGGVHSLPLRLLHVAICRRTS